MQKTLETYEEDRLTEKTDSDRYCLDNLDLLNLKISFSSDATNKREKRGNKVRSKSSENSSRSETNHLPHCQNFSEAISASGNYIQTQPQVTTSKPIQKFLELGDGHPNTTNNLVLYSNQQGTYKSDSDNLTKCYKKRKNLKTKNVEIHTISNSMSHPHRSSRKKTPMKETPTGETGAFPFKVTPSGNFKVNSHQVVFESQKLSVLVADPEHTKVNIHPENSNEPMQKQVNHDCPKNAVMESIMGQGTIGGSLGTLIASTAPVRREKEASEYEGKITDQILDPELNLHRLGYTAAEPIDWQDVKLPEKTNLYLELYQRITNYTNADCKVYIENEEFNCHLIVLQCYSEVFDEYVAVKKVELPSDKVSTSAFAFIYEWMITGEPAYTDLNRESVLNIFNASKYLKIKDLTEQCWAFIDNTEVFCEDTAFLLYLDAKQKKLIDVRELMMPRIQKFFLMLVSSQDWLDLEKEDVINFLNSNYICVNCEMEIFMSSVRWLKHRWEEREKDTLDIMSCVRFGNIAPWQLVDIKRNPENPEFLKLTSITEICKMIDDGLAFVIIKYWYGQENDDFQHWNNILGLHEPSPRNWSGMDKTYFTYREFLIYLDQYRRNQMLERSKPKDRKHRSMVETKSPARETSERSPPKIPTMDEFLTNRKANHSFRMPLKLMDPNVAATIIQAAFRGFLIRKMMKIFVPRLNLRSPRTKQKLDKPYPSQQLPWRTNTNFKVLALFNAGEPSKSTCGKPGSRSGRKDYLCETSLFSPERESVLVFGGTDPHNNYGTSQNTGKDVFRYLPDSNIWEYVGDLPEPRHHHSAAFLKGRVYLCGGADPRDGEVKGKSIVVDTVWSFEPIKKSWFIESSLGTARKNFGLVASNFSLYAIGGQDKHGRTLASVEKFVPETNCWEFQAPLKNPRMGIACTKFKEDIWAAGGMSGSRKNPLLNTVECFNIGNNQWTEISGLRYPCCFGRMFSLSDRLYFIGGAGKLTQKEKNTNSVAAIDIWCDRTKEWKHHTDMAIPRHGHAIAYLGTQILVIGGVTTVYMRALSNTECYCTERGTWVRGIACLPTTLSGHAAVTLPPASLI